MAPTKAVTLDVDGQTVSVSSPDKMFFAEAGVTKLDLVRYYLSVADGALRGVRDRPMAMKRFPNGAGSDFFFQKRAPANLPPFVRTVELSFPSGRTADEVVVSNAAALAWVVNLGCIDLNPHPVRGNDLDHPDELRVDLDPGPGVEWSDVRAVALVCRELFDELGYTSWPKTSGSRGIHVYVRIEPRWSYGEVRRAALAVAREVERRAPALATSKWWKEERHGVFLDYNQNAKDRTVASAYSVRPLPDARVSTPLTWGEVPDCDAADFTVKTVPDRFARIGDVGAGIDDHAYSLEPLLELVARHEADGLGDAPWPPNYAKQPGEPPRVQPSKARKDVPSPTGRRRSSAPLVVVAQAATKPEVEEGLERWKKRHRKAAKLLAVDDVLYDAMRGRSTVWWRVRVNLRHVPEKDRPKAEPPDPDYDPRAGFEWSDRSDRPDHAPPKKKPASD
ncbi:MAG TPA: non-homologous end-joining DNA ligase [Candidatus Limnocylindria bacterium]|jgi:DNA ligase D-like protein (predicted polymerase)|nr:non-homologous end-joining DNA ligase [Candidatus Limnocylindria bacterium]